MQKMLSNHILQLCAPWCWANKAQNLYELVCCNIIVILIKLSAFIGLNCNNFIIMHGMKNMKLINTTVKFMAVTIKIRVG